jgi:hypothetical protein
MDEQHHFWLRPEQIVWGEAYASKTITKVERGRCRRALPRSSSRRYTQLGTHTLHIKFLEQPEPVELRVVVQRVTKPVVERKRMPAKERHALFLAKKAGEQPKAAGATAATTAASKPEATKGAPEAKPAPKQGTAAKGDQPKAEKKDGAPQ